MRDRRALSLLTALLPLLALPACSASPGHSAAEKPVVAVLLRT
jgi:hypothetical protein